PLASIAKSSKSVRWNTIPVPAGAGRIRRLTGAPLWRPTPVQATAVRIVCSCVKGKAYKSFVVCQLNVMGKLMHVAKQPHSVVGVTGATLTCSGGYRCLGVSRAELGDVSRHLSGILASLTVFSAAPSGRTSPPL